MSIYSFNFVSVISIFVFFFSSRRRHTRSLCDWSSDVCSSDLSDRPSQASSQEVIHGSAHAGNPRQPREGLRGRVHTGSRSEERRVGKECRSRWSADHEKKKKRM